MNSTKEQQAQPMTFILHKTLQWCNSLSSCKTTLYIYTKHQNMWTCCTACVQRSANISNWKKMFPFISYNIKRILIVDKNYLVNYKVPNKAIYRQIHSPPPFFFSSLLNSKNNGCWLPNFETLVILKYCFSSFFLAGSGWPDIYENSDSKNIKLLHLI